MLQRAVSAVGGGGGGGTVLIAWAKGESITEANGNDSNYCSVAKTGGGTSAQHTITFSKDCAGYLGIANNINMSGTASTTQVSSYATYTDKLFSFTASAGDTLIMKQRDWYAGYEIMGS